MARPLRKTYFSARPYVVERHDQENGTISFEIWDYRPDSYRRLCSLNERNDSLDWDANDKRPPHNAKSDAELIARALNDLTACPHSGETK